MVRKCYSYIRFSSQKQAKGDSLHRQLEWSSRFALEQGWELDESLKPDLSTSAFRGRHKVRGNLGAFLQAIENGQVPRGSILLIESLDRLSREQIKEAWKLFERILDAKVDIITREPFKKFTYKDLDDGWKRTEATIYMMRSNEESQVKSMRAHAVWERRRVNLKNGIKIAQKCPAWLQFNKETKQFEIIKDRADAIRLIFSLCANGSSINGTLRELQNRKIPAIGSSGKWTRAYVQMTLGNRSTLGEYQPQKTALVKTDEADEFSDETHRTVPAGEVVRDYFPAIVSEETFYKAQAARNNRGIIGRGRTGSEVSNLFTGICFDARSGSRMQVEYRKPDPTKKKKILISQDGRNLVPGAPLTSVDYDAFEKLVLNLLHEIKPTDLQRKIESPSEGSSLENRLVVVQSKISELQNQIKNEPSFQDLLPILRDLGSEKKELIAKIEKQKSEAASQVAHKEIQNVIEFSKTVQPEELVAYRNRLKSMISHLVDSIWIHGRKLENGVRVTWVQIVLKSGKIKQGQVVWITKGPAIGYVGIAGMDVPSTYEDLVLGNEDLRQYRTDSEVRQFVDELHGRDNEFILQHVSKVNARAKISREGIGEEVEEIVFQLVANNASHR